LISSMGKSDGEWFEDVEIENQTIKVQIDTGTKESIMPISVFQLYTPIRRKGQAYN